MKRLLIAAVFCAPTAAVLSSQTGNGRVDRLLLEMTLAEKIAMIHGVPEDPAASQGQPGYVPGIRRLGIPPLRLVDGAARVAHEGLVDRQPPIFSWARRTRLAVCHSRGRAASTRCWRTIRLTRSAPTAESTAGRRTPKASSSAIAGATNRTSRPCSRSDTVPPIPLLPTPGCEWRARRMAAWT